MADVNQSENYAILFSGGGNAENNHNRYLGSLRSMYEALVEKRGLNPKNIVILYADAGLGDINFNRNIDGSFEGFFEVADLLEEYGYPSGRLEEFKDGYAAGRTLDSQPVYSREELQDFDKSYRYLRDFVLRKGLPIDVSEPKYAESEKQPGKYVVDLGDVLVRSDLSFARNQDSVVLSATPSDLQRVLTDRSSADSILNRIDDNDHLFFWTFDHGNFAGEEVKQNGDPDDGTEINTWGSRAAGNRAVLVDYAPDKPLFIPNQDLALWLRPLIAQSGATTLAYAQCYAGGMLEASLSDLDTAPRSYGMAAANGYEVSNGYGFAAGLELALKNGNPLARDLFVDAKNSDKFASTEAYVNNGGSREPGVEHPWAYGPTDGDFLVFTDGSSVHSLEEEGIDVLDSGDPLVDGNLESLTLQLKEDSMGDVMSVLVERFGADVKIDAVALPGKGSLERIDGQLYYVPMPDYHGRDSFSLSYSMPTSSGRLSMFLDVESVNDAPILSDDFVSVDPGVKRVKFSVDSQQGFLGDFDVDGQRLRVTDYSAPQNGRIKKIGRNSFIYKPNDGFEGKDSILYQITDGEAYSVAEVTFTVGGDTFSRDPVGGSYGLKSEGPDPIVNPLRGRDGSVLSDDTSSRWDIVAAEKDGDRYNLLLQAEGKKEGLYQVWTADESGEVVKQRKRWLGPDQLEQKVYGSSFGNVVNNNAIGSFDTRIEEVDIIASI